MPYGWLTPDSIPSATKCRALVIPDDLAIIMAVSGALADLTYAHNWQKFGTVEPEEIADAMRIMYLAFIESLNDCEPAVSIPIGSIMGFGAASLPPKWLYCNGDEVLKASYPELYDVIVNIWGTPTLGSDYFVLPDYRNKSPFGFQYGGSPLYPLGSDQGALTHTLTTAQIPAHSHTTYAPELYATAQAGAGTAGIGGAIPNAGIVTGNTGGGDPHNNLHPVAVCGVIIYAGV
jgi:microcystin-dependent protein